MIWYDFCITSFSAAVMRQPKHGVGVSMLMGEVIRSVLRSTAWIPVTAFFLALPFVAACPFTNRAAAATVRIILFINPDLHYLLFPIYDAAPSGLYYIYNKVKGTMQDFASFAAEGLRGAIQQWHLFVLCVSGREKKIRRLARLSPTGLRIIDSVCIKTLQERVFTSDLSCRRECRGCS